MDNRSSDFHPPTTMFSLSPLRKVPTGLAKQNPRKKRSKIMAGGAASRVSKSTRKPDPAAPKITRPCTECGKRFWSWKALFGHMRCHPEREWRGINPPPYFRRHHDSEDSSAVTEEDHEVASCLLLLANGDDDHESRSTACTVNQGTPPPQHFDFYYYYNLDNNTNNNNNNNDRGFECSSCKKVFVSHQALGGHRASHKNVKGCYAIAMNNVDDQEHSIEGDSTHDTNQMIAGHKCGICMRVFSSGQALGGHKRCHWEKAAAEEEAGGFDLNFPAVDGEDQEYASSYSSIDSAGFRHPYLDLSLRL